METGTIQDTKNRVWEISVNYGTLEKIQKHLGINILFEVLPREKEAPEFYETCSLEELPLMSRLQCDDLLFVNVLFCLCMDQADQRGVEPKDFGSSLDPQIVTAARDIFWRELENFFRKMGAGHRPQVLAIQQLRKGLMEYQKLEEELGPKTDQLLPQVEAQMSKILQQTRKDFEKLISSSLDTRSAAASESEISASSPYAS